MYKRIISFVLVIATVFCFAVPTAFAATEYYSEPVTWGEYILTGYYKNAKDVWDEDSPLPFIGTAIKSITTTLMYNKICEQSHDGYHASLGESISHEAFGMDEHGRYCLLSCDYCGEWFRCYSSDLIAAHDEYVASLPDGISASNSGVTAFGAGYTYTTDSTYEEMGDLLWQKFDIYSAAASAELGQFIAITANSHNQLVGLKKITNTNTGFYALQLYSVKEDSSYLSPYSPGTIPFQKFVSFDSFYMETTSSFTITGYTSSFATSPVFVYLNYSDAYAAYQQLDLTSGYIHYLLPETYIDINFKASASSYYIPITFYNLGRISISDATTEVVTASTLMEYKNYGQTSSYYTVFPLVPNYVLLDIADYSALTRSGSLMQTINNYNVDNSVVDNSSNVNYYISPKSYVTELPDDTIDIEQCYSPQSYDEETLVFTEPVTGAQILTSGWTYNYETRTYDIDVPSGTTTDSYGVDITRIELIYGDEAVTYNYYLADDTLVQSDEYAYVMVSGDETFGTGGSSGEPEEPDEPEDPGEDPGEETHKHSYTSTVTTDPTCEAPGIRKYTCSECGDSYTEKISAAGHTWTVKQTVATQYDDSGSVTVQGYTIYKCSVCNTEYKDDAGTGPPNNSADSGDDEGIFKKFGQLLGSILSGLLGMIEAVLGGLLDGLVRLADLVGDKLTQVVDIVTGLFDKIPQLFGGFTALLADVFVFIPEDIMTIFTFGAAAIVFVGILMFFLKR